MKDAILSCLNDPQKLEKLYRSNKVGFKRAFSTLYPELKGEPLANFWNERLNYESEDINWGTGKDLLFILLAALVTGVAVKLPSILHLDEELFYMRHISFLVFPSLSAYFAWKNRLSTGKTVLIAGATLASLLFINFLPGSGKSDTFLLSCLHLAVLLWSITGFAFVGDQPQSDDKRLGYLRYNGDLAVMTALLLIAGGILTGVTIGLFSLIGLSIEVFYRDYIIACCLPAAPILGTWLIRTNPQLVGKVSPVIARLFSPLVLAMLVAYLIAIVYSGKDPYNDRDSLLLFNALLIGVMAIIFFSIAEAAKGASHRTTVWTLFLLSVVTIVVNGIALSAILFRISSGGFTPNRTAVLGSNVLILLNLLLVAWQLYKVLVKKAETGMVGNVIARYLPVYAVWAAVVAFLFPFLFGFK
jgi:hypothetical protein